MERPLDYLNNANNDWLIGDDSHKFSELATQLYLELSQLLKQGTIPKIILAQSDRVLFLAGFIAACAAECPVFLCNPNWVKQEWQQVFELVQPDLFLGYGDWETRGILLPTHHLPLDTYTYTDKLIKYNWMKTGNSFSPFPTQSHFSPIMIPTGGSSGKIRFAIHTWETLMASVQGFQKYFQVNQINSFCLLPFYHVSGLMQFLRSLTTNGKLVLADKSVVDGEIPDINPDEFFISLVPTQLQRLLQNPALADWLSRFKTVLLGGAPAWTELLETARSYGIRLAPTYGMTETASQIVTLKPEDFLKGYNNCGRVLPHAQVSILDSENRILEANRIGNINIKAESLALGYYPELFKYQELKLDDVGFFDEQGYLNIIGRNSNKIITGGENVYPNEVEAAIRATQLVDDVYIIGIGDRTWGQAVTAVYVPRYTSVTSDQIKQAIADKLSKYKQPKNWIAIDNLSRNNQGKINREHLHQLATKILSDRYTNKIGVVESE